MIHMGPGVHSQHLVFGVVCKFCQVPAVEFQKFQSALPGKSLITPVFSIRLRCNFQHQITQVVVQDIRIRTHDGNGIPDISFCVDHLPISIHTSGPRCRIQAAFVIPLRKKFRFLSPVSFFHIHAVDMTGIVSFDHQSFIGEVLGISGRRQGNGVKERHRCSGRIR